MDILQKMVDFLAGVPDWAFLYAVPVLILLTAVGFIFAPKRRWYFCVAAFFAATGFLTVYAKNARLSIFYLGLAVVICALSALFFLIPRPRKKEKRKKKSRDERMYEKFHEELSEKPYQRASAFMPQKVCCFEAEGEELATAPECGTSLSYADSLLEKLRAKKLDAGDRLETEELLSRLDGYRNKALTQFERSSLNDCLASVLKLTAKYGL